MCTMVTEAIYKEKLLICAFGLSLVFPIKLLAYISLLIYSYGLFETAYIEPSKIARLSVNIFIKNPPTVEDTNLPQ